MPCEVLEKRAQRLTAEIDKCTESLVREKLAFRVRFLTDYSYSNLVPIALQVQFAIRISRDKMKMYETLLLSGAREGGVACQWRLLQGHLHGTSSTMGTRRARDVQAISESIARMEELRTRLNL